MKIKYLLLTALVIVSMILATGCGAAPATTQPSSPTEAPGGAAAPAGETRTVTVWGFVWTADWLDAIAPGFEAEHPGVKVNVERFEYDPYQEMVLTTLASGQGVPDVVTL